MVLVQERLDALDAQTIHELGEAFAGMQVEDVGELGRAHSGSSRQVVFPQLPAKVPSDVFYGSRNAGGLSPARVFPNAVQGSFRECRRMTQVVGPLGLGEQDGECRQLFTHAFSLCFKDTFSRIAYERDLNNTISHSAGLG